MRGTRRSRAAADDLTLAYAITAAWLGAAAAADIWLVRGGRRPMTHALRTPAGLAFLAVLNLHVLDVLGAVDPFRWAGRFVGGAPRKSAL